MSGIEVAGIVLAALPLFVEAAKGYSQGADSIRKVASRRERDQKLADFYSEFYWELFQLDRQLQAVVDNLPTLSDARKAELFVQVRQDDWKPGADVSQALFDFFGAKEDFDAFLVVMSRVAQLLCQIVKDPSIHISSGDLDQSKMVNKLKSFAFDMEAGQTSATFIERLRFWKKDKDRKICLKNLGTWNKRLFRLIEEARREPTPKNTATTSPGIPSSNVRMLSQKLYRALAKCWRSCNCNGRHEARFCLKFRGGTNAKSDTVEVDLDFVVLVRADQASPPGWREGTVAIRPNSTVHDDRSLLQRICDAIDCSGSADDCLQLLVEDSETDQAVWQLRSLPRRLPKSVTAQSVSLHWMLENAIMLPLATKRRLAVIFAHSLLGLHDSHWLRNGLDKSHIFFFCDSKGTPDFLRPYLSTVFIEDSGAVLAEKPDLTQFHRNKSILALGILLIELHAGRCIESFRTPGDLQDVNRNTDWLVADHVVKTLEDECSFGYRYAVQACLDTHWIPAGQRVSLEDIATRSGLYQDVIQPLEEELSFLFREKL
ncbi:hypothetical protein K469DRAFT_585514 [Zopfia rhizophila CBS 207.26]|uniref:DUF7580 domain-containing protein n=1 Tax=Zopfia rhizophila CBS 207.26 TaxID=1314779 RepID=A0A6A6DY04_9PEZI|nr:hypothetical protein K469DRAFT_585514 [Zopfia rhizophila CBS 207.26]